VRSPGKALIPFARTSVIAQKYSQNGRLPCVIFLKVARLGRNHPSKTIEKANQ
jgi:hypothetical protein